MKGQLKKTNILSFYECSIITLKTCNWENWVAQISLSVKRFCFKVQATFVCKTGHRAEDKTLLFTNTESQNVKSMMWFKSSFNTAVEIF